MRQVATLVTAVVILCLGAQAVLTRRNMVRICLGLSLMETAAILMVVTLAWNPGATAPILMPGTDSYVDPLPHALALTAIVIGASITALALALVVRVHRSVGTVNLEEVQRVLQ